MQKTILYTSLFRPPLDSIGYFADRVFQEKSTFDFFRIIAEDVFPLICEGKSYSNFYLKFDQEQNAYSLKYIEVQKQLRREIKDSFLELEPKLNQTEVFSKNPSVLLAVKALQIFCDLDLEKPIGTYFIREAFDQFKHICYQLLSLDEIKLLEPYCKIVYIEKYEENQKDEKWSTYKEANISLFTFVPSIEKLFELDEMFSWDKVKDPFVAFEYVKLVAWCWKTELAYFENKNVDFGNLNMLAIQELNLHGFWVEMNIIKTKDVGYEDSINFFTKDRFIKYLKLLLDIMLLSQNIAKEDFKIYSLSLRHINNEQYLLLDVKWDKYGHEETYKLHKLAHQSAPYKIIQYCLNHDKGSILDVRDIDRNFSVSKFFKRIKCSEDLAKVFFHQVDSYKISFYGNDRLIEDLEGLKLKELHSFIIKLKKHTK